MKYLVIAIVLSFFIGCSVPIKFPITSTTGLTAFESGLWGYQQDLLRLKYCLSGDNGEGIFPPDLLKDPQRPKYTMTLLTCQGQAAKEYYQLKAQGYDACIMAGYKMGAGHVQASVMKDGIPLDLMDMQVTHIITESGIWRVKK